MIFPAFAEATVESEGSSIDEEAKATTPSGGENRKEDSQQIVDFGSAVSLSKRGNIYTLTIVGQEELELHLLLPNIPHF